MRLAIKERICRLNDITKLKISIDPMISPKKPADTSGLEVLLASLGVEVSSTFEVALGVEVSSTFEADSVATKIYAILTQILLYYTNVAIANA